MPCLWILVIALFGAGVAQIGSVTVPTDVHTPQEIELPFMSFGPSPQTDRYLTPGCRRRIVLLFAGDFTGHAPPAGILFDNQCMLFMAPLGPFVIGHPILYFSGCL